MELGFAAAAVYCDTSNKREVKTNKTKAKQTEQGQITALRGEL